MTQAQAYSRFMTAFMLFAGLGPILRPLNVAPPGGLLLWPEPGMLLGIFLTNWFHGVLHLALCALGLVAAWRTWSARLHAQAIFVAAGLLLVIGLVTPDGVWLVPASWPADVTDGQIVLSAQPQWYGFITANWADDLVNLLVASSGFMFGLTPIGYRPWRAQPGLARAARAPLETRGRSC
jgi:hypothetical protein